MNQALAILVDGYRDLSARRLFWLTLIFSGVVMAAFGLLGVKDGEIYFLWYHEEIPFAQMVYDGVFAYLVMGIWLTWVAVALALISTAGIFPDLLAGGTIDLYLARPISRLRFFLIKYASGLLFVTIQVAIFATASFLVMALRGHQFRWTLFLAVPVVVCFYSYLYCVCVFLGVWMRSTIAALLLTLLFWGLCSMTYQADALVLLFRQEAERTARYSPGPDQKNSVRQWAAADRSLTTALAVLPRVKPTLNLLNDWMFPEGVESIFGRNRRDEDRTALLAEMHRRDGTAVSAIGYSLIFEVVMLGAAAWIFCRRDY